VAEVTAAVLGHVTAFGQAVGQGWAQVGDLAVAFVLCSLIGLERELRDKSAGLRTQTVVGLGAALFALVSKYGFHDVQGGHGVSYDPSRIASLVVSGIGFIGGGVIFVRRERIVRGLTTAAVVWLSAAVGLAAGTGLPVLAAVGTAAYLLIAFVYTPISHRLGAVQWRDLPEPIEPASEGATGEARGPRAGPGSSPPDPG
jgi:putative Mg2+ transporter-C (MgtC) family protein